MVIHLALPDFRPFELLMRRALATTRWGGLDRVMIRNMRDTLAKTINIILSDCDETSSRE